MELVKSITFFILIYFIRELKCHDYCDSVTSLSNATCITLPPRKAVTTASEDWETLPNPADRIQSLISSGLKKLNLKIKNKTGVVILGNTGSGKTTLTLLLSSNLRKLHAVKTQSGSLVIVDDDHKIGLPSITSKTLIPEYSVANNSVAFYDCPGFDDNRGPETDIATMTFIKQVLSHLDELKILFTVPQSSIQLGSDKLDFGVLSRHVASLLVDIKMFKDSIGLVITKVKSYDANGECKSDESIINEAVEFLQNFRQHLLEKSESSHKSDEEKELLKREIEFVDILLQRHWLNTGFYTRISFLRNPPSCGNYQDIPYMSQVRGKLTQFYQDLTYAKVTPDDFGFTLKQSTLLSLQTEIIPEMVDQLSEESSEIFGIIRSNYSEIFSNTLQIEDDSGEKLEAIVKLNNDLNSFRSYLRDLPGNESYSGAISNILNIFEWNSMPKLEKLREKEESLNYLYSFSSKPNSGESLNSHLTSELTMIRLLLTRLHRSTTRKLLREDIPNLTNTICEKTQEIIDSYIQDFLRFLQDEDNKKVGMELNYFTEILNLANDLALGDASGIDLLEKLGVYFETEIKEVKRLSKEVMEYQKIASQNPQFPLKSCSDKILAGLENGKENATYFVTNKLQKKAKMGLKTLLLESGKSLISGLEEIVSILNETDEGRTKIIGLVEEIKSDLNYLDEIHKIDKNNLENELKLFSIIFQQKLPEELAKNISNVGRELEIIWDFIGLEKQSFATAEIWRKLRIDFVNLRSRLMTTLITEWTPQLLVKREVLMTSTFFQFGSTHLQSSGMIPDRAGIENALDKYHTAYLIVQGLIVDNSDVNSLVEATQKVAEAFGLDFKPSYEFYQMDWIASYYMETWLSDMDIGLTGYRSALTLLLSKFRERIEWFEYVQRVDNQLGSYEKLAEVYALLGQETDGSKFIEELSQLNPVAIGKLGIPLWNNSLNDFDKELLSSVLTYPITGKGIEESDKCKNENGKVEISIAQRFLSFSSISKLFEECSGDGDVKIINVFATDTIYFDGNLTARGVKVNVIAPKWVVLLNKSPTIDLVNGSLLGIFKKVVGAPGLRIKVSSNLDFRNTLNVSYAIDAGVQMDAFHDNNVSNPPTDKWKESIDSFKEYATVTDGSLSSWNFVNEMDDSFGSVILDVKSLAKDTFNLERSRAQQKLNHLDYSKQYLFLMGKIENFAIQKGTGISRAEKKILNYLYISVITKLLEIEEEKEQNNEMIINVKKYFDLIESDMESLKEGQVKAIISEHRNSYKGKLDSSVYQVENIMENNVLPVFTRLEKDLEALVSKAVEEMNSFLTEAKQDLEKRIVERRAFQKAFIMQKIMGALRIAAMAASFIPKVGAVASAGLHAASSAMDLMGLGNSPYLRPQMQLSAAISGQAGFQTEQLLGRKMRGVQGQLEVLDKFINDNKISGAELQNATNNLRELHISIDNGTSAITDPFHLLHELSKSEKKLEAAIKEQISQFHHSGQDNLKRSLESVKNQVILARTSPELYNRTSQSYKIPSEAEEWDKSVVMAAEQIKLIELQTEQLEEALLPLTKNAMDFIKAKVNDLQSGEWKPSKAFITSWRMNMKESVRNVRKLLKEFVEGLNAEQDLNEMIHLLDDALEAISKMYDNIAEYEEQKVFSDYIENVNSPDALGIDVEGELKDVLIKTELLIKLNLIKTEYAKGLQALRQYSFPYGKRYLKQIQAVQHSLFVEKEDDFITEAEKIISGFNHVRKQLGRYEAMTVGEDRTLVRAQFTSLVNGTRPFYVWTREDHEGDINGLLEGNKIYLNADIRKEMESRKGAVKFSSVRLYLKCEDFSVQREMESVLSHFQIILEHSGISHYKIQDKIVTFFSPKQEYRDSLAAQNMVNVKANQSFILSPFTLWGMQIIDGEEGHGGDLEELRRFFGKVEAIELHGWGLYVDEARMEAGDFDMMELERYYQVSS